MIYDIKIIESKKDLDGCPGFEVDNFNWGGDYRPKTSGRLAYVQDKGFLIRLETDERNPVTDYRNYQDPVYKDCAMEAFFDLSPEEGKFHYTNLEMNSAGALLNHFGGLRGSRSDVKAYTDMVLKPVTEVREDGWSVELLIPNEYAQDLFGKGSFKTGDRIRFTCYTIREVGDERGPAHFASMAPIRTEKPDFHRPEFFADGILV